MTSLSLALCAATPIRDEGGTVPQWVHLLPSGEIETRDGRGPYRVADMAALAASSLADAYGKMVLDENHSTDLAAPKGDPAPARGWIVDLQARSDGLWGRVDWTSEGRKRMEQREYRGVSPVIAHRSDGTITGVLRASLVNQPNFVGLTSLHMAQGAARVDDVDRAVAKQLGYSHAEFSYRLNSSPEFRQQIEPTRRYFQARIADLHAASGKLPLSNADRDVIALMGIDAGQFQATKADDDDGKAKYQPSIQRSSQPRETDDVDEAVAAYLGIDVKRFAELLASQEFRDQIEPMRQRFIKEGVRLVDEKEVPLSAADDAIISTMGLDPEAYRANLAKEGLRTSLHRMTGMGTGGQSIALLMAQFPVSQ